MTRLAEWTMLAHGWRRFLLLLTSEQTRRGEVTRLHVEWVDEPDPQFLMALMTQLELQTDGWVVDSNAPPVEEKSSGRGDNK